MAYIGVSPNAGTVATQIITSANGSATSFTLDQTVPDGQSIIVLVGNVVQQPTHQGIAGAYTASGNTITFTGPPANGDNIIIRYLGRSVDVATNYKRIIRYRYVATNGQQTFSGEDSNGLTLSYTVEDIDVFLNGVRLDQTDYTATNGTSVVLGSGATTSDELVVLAYNTVQLADTVPASTGGTFTGATTHSGGVNLPDNAKIKVGTGNDLQIYHTPGTGSFIDEADDGSLFIRSSRVTMHKYTGETMINAVADGAVSLYYDDVKKLETTANGIGVENGATYSHDTNMKGVDVGDQAFYGEYDGGSLYIVKNRYYNGSSWVAKENGAGSAINIDTSGVFHYQYSANVNAGQNATLTTIASILNEYSIFKNTRNSVAQYFQNLHSSAPYGVYIEFPNVNVNNTDNYFLSCVSQGNGRMKIFSSGTLKNSTGTYTSFSDERLKSDIVDAKSQWEDIKALKFKNFTKFDNPDLKQLGLVAQDVEKVCPNLVFETPPEAQEIKHSSEFGTLNEDGDVKEVKSNVKNVKDSILYMKAVKALQEAMTRIETLEAKVKALEEA
tara:strand:- start:10224 stop:11891 length:1668 start_codon:yes stop_codon:yes gene_type:complete